MAVRKPPVIAAGIALTCAKTVVKSERAEVGDQQKHREQEAEVADAVDDEGLLAGVGGGVTREIKADEQVGGETHTLPADEEQQETGRKHKHQHEKHEQVEVCEEAPVTLVLGHVTRGIDVDEKADTGNDGQHDQREVIDGEAETHLKAGDGDPGAAADAQRQWGVCAEHVGPKAHNDERGARA